MCGALAICTFESPTNCDRRRACGLVSAAVTEHGGELVKFTGDGALARFSTASSASRAANRLVETAERQTGEPDGLSLAIRVG